MFVWVEACNTTIYVQKRIPHGILGDKTREESFSRVNAKDRTFEDLWLSGLHPVHVEKRMKLDPSG
jgi:hypothetical protein